MTDALSRAGALLQMGRHSQAAALIQQFLLQHPQIAAAHALLASCHCALEEYEAAESEAKLALSLDPEEDGAMEVLARVEIERGNLEKARGYIESALRIDPSDADHFNGLALIRCEEEEWLEASKAAEAGLRINPEHELNLQVLALSLMQQGREGAAREAAEHALRLNPENAAAHSVAMLACFNRGELAAAMRHLRESRRLDPVEAPFRLGAIAVAFMAWGQYGFRTPRTILDGVFAPHTQTARQRFFARACLAALLGSVLFGLAYLWTGEGEYLVPTVSWMLVAMPGHTVVAFRSKLRWVPLSVMLLAAFCGLGATVSSLLAPDKGPSYYNTLSLLFILLAFVPAMATPWIGGFYYVRMILRGEEP